ncbi:MAG: hypothetical protein IPG07_10135 [Crocinitomicaceae bacterium]|nr:hypothetical protein [Crocinitomicaceae bacterium]
MIFYYEDVTELDQSKMEEVLAFGFSITYSEDGKHCIYPFEGQVWLCKISVV